MKKNIKPGKVSRRRFLKQASLATAAASLGPAMISLSPRKVKAASYSALNVLPGRVVINYNNTHSASPTSGSAADQTILRTMVDDAIKLLTGKTDVGEAWKSLFPTLTTSTNIAIKINFNYNTGLPAHPFLVKGITEGLQQMQVGGSGFPAGNIYLYEANGGGTFDAAGFNTTLFPSPIHRVAQDTLSVYGDGAWNNSRYANTLYNCSYLINVPGIRGHGSEFGSVTMGFKSHFGTYPPNHSGQYAEYLSAINCTGPVSISLKWKHRGTYFSSPLY